ncbi:glycosyltransferase family 9 protein [Pantoea allii]|uniref:glycosyltransferase family 9 protein n=1 Tax=Pantoea allii TaxID=574096 RepID=UPI0024B87297|nr:glycosyltransferase family 9 protein [Pantoea allii]MDJ0037555.1 glycosyltransferase family 9 protein [Pantoea allii]
MRKRWKFELINLFLRIVTRRNGMVDSRAEFLSHNHQNDFKHIVIYSTTALGDFMMNTPAIHALRQRFPTATITLVAHPKFQEFLEGGDDWDRVIYWNSKVKHVPELVKSLEQSGKPDLVVILHSHAPYDYTSAVLAGAKYIFRDNYQDDVPLIERWLTNYTVGYKGHLIQRKLELVAPLGCDTSLVEMKTPRKPQERSARRDKKILGFQLGASSPERCWPIESFAQVADILLSRNESLSIVLIGGPGETGLADRFMEQISPQLKSRIVSQVGKTSLSQLVETVNEFDALLTGDTGPLHVAIALKVPTLSLFATEQPVFSGPYQNQEIHQVILGVRSALKAETMGNGAMKSISVDQVLAKLEDHFDVVLPL